MGRSVYRVMPDVERAGNWKLEHDGQILSSHETKDDAVEAGRDLAHEHQPSQLVIHASDGRIEAAHTYQADPYSPRG